MRAFLLSLFVFITASAFSQANGDFRSRQTGDWNASSTWQEFIAGSWQNTANTPTSANGAITIRSTHNVTVTAGVTIDQTTVQSGGTITINGGIVLTVADGAGNDLTNAGSVISPSVNELIFQNSAAYDHARNGGTIPLATWMPESDCRVTGTTNSVPGGLNPTGGFYHFTWHAGDQSSTINLNGNLVNVAGDLTIVGTNGKVLQLCTNSAPSPVSIGGSLNLLNSARLTLTVSAAITLNISGALNINAPGGSGGIFNLSEGSGNSTVNLSGDFTLTAGTVTETSTGSGTFNFVLNGTQQFSNTGTIQNFVIYNIGTTTALNVIGESPLTGGTLIVNGSLRVGSLNSTGAIVTGNTAGNIRTNNRIYNSGSRIVYAGTGPQFIGNGHPTAAGVITELDNTNGVTFNTTTLGNSADFELLIPDNLILTSGDLNIVTEASLGRVLTLNGDVTSNGNTINVSGPRTDIAVNGTGAFGTFPFPAGSQTIRNFTFNRTVGTIDFANTLTITGTTTISSGAVNFNATATLSGPVSLAAGTTLFFEGQTLTMGDNFTSSGGQLSADNQSTLILSGSTAHTSALAFTPTGNNLQNLTIDKSNAGTSVTVNAALTVTSALTLTDGELSITGSALTLNNGSTLSRASQASITGSRPAGGPWNLIYVTGSLTTGMEIPASGSLLSLTVDSNNSAVVTLSQNINVSGAVTISQSGRTLTAGTRSITAGSLANSGTFNAPNGSATIGLLLNGNFTNNGTFLHNNGTMTINGTVTLDGSTMDATDFNNIIVNASGTLTPSAMLRIQGNLTNNGSFVPGTGTVLFWGTAGSKTISGTSDVQFFNLSVNKTNSGLSLSVNSAQTVTNTLALADGQFNFAPGNFTLSNGATIIMNSDASIVTASPSGGPWHLEYRNRSQTTGLEVPASGQLLSLTINISTGTVTLDQDLIISGGFNIIDAGATFTSGANNIQTGSFSNSGTFNAPTSGAATGLTLSGLFTNDATYNHNNGTLHVGGAVTMAGTNIGATNFFNITIDGSGTLTAPPSNLRIEGSFINNGTLVAGTGTVFFRGSTGSQTIGGTTNTQFYDININKGNPGISLTVTSPQTITNSLTLTDGQLEIPAGELIFGNGAVLTRNSDGSVSGSSPSGGPWNLIYTGASMATSLEIPTIGSLASLTVNMNSGTVLTLTSNVAVNNTFTINAQATGPTVTSGGSTITAADLVNGGIFNAPSSTLTLTGNLTNNRIFNAGSGTVVFDGNSLVNGTNAIVFNHIAITAAGTFTGPPVLELTGDFTNNGTFNASAGTVLFTGAASQSISGLAITDFEDITVNKTAGNLTLSSVQNLNGTLTIQTATTVASNGNLVVVSTSENVADDGKIGPLLGGANVSGNVTVQRFIAAADNAERLISPPVSNAAVSQLQQAFPVTGSFTGTSYPCTGCGNNGGSLKFYREHIQGDLQLGYRAFPFDSNTETLLPGRGYVSYMWNGVAPSTINYSGPINTGQVDFIITHTPSAPPNPNNDGWNLIGNPYPSPIAWDNGGGWVKNLMHSVAYVWDADASVFRTYDADTQLGDLTDGVIATGQSFWVYANQPGASLSINENAKTSFSGVFMREKKNPLSGLTVSLSNGNHADNSFIITASKDQPVTEAPKFSEMEKFSVALMDERGRKLVFYKLDEIHNDLNIPLFVVARQSGKYEISFSSIGNFEGSDQLYLKDSYLGITRSIAEPYGFTLNTENVKSYQQRFFITTVPDSQEERALILDAYPNPATAILNIEINTENIHPVVLKDAMGRILEEVVMQRHGGVSRGQSDMRDRPSGLYLIQTKANDKLLIKKIIKN